MTVGADSERTLLLILPRRNELFPLSPAALTQASRSRRTLARDYRDALIVDRAGTLCRIDQIEVLGLWGESRGRRFLSALNSDWRITTHLSEPLSWTLDEVKRLLAECVEGHEILEWPDQDEPEPGFYRPNTASAILAAPTIRQVFAILKVPPPEDALDVL